MSGVRYASRFPRVSRWTVAWAGAVIAATAAIVAGANASATEHVRRVEIPVSAFPSVVTAVAGSVWLLAGGRLLRVDPTTDKVVSQIDAGVRLGSERTCDLAVADGIVWAIGSVNDRRSQVVRFDARGGRVIGSTAVPLAACVAAIARGAWVTLPEARMIVRLDRAGRVLQRVPTKCLL